MAELQRDAGRARDESVAALIADIDQAELSRDLGEVRDLEAPARVSPTAATASAPIAATTSGSAG